MNANEPRIGTVALRGVGWSVVQNWGGRVFTFVLFIVLARFLAPAEFGLVTAATIVLTLIGLVAEFGFGDAIVQRRTFEPADANLPFFVSIAAASLLALVCALNAQRIELWLDVPGLAPIVQVLAPVAPLSTIALFQEVNYRRAFAFRPLAFRVLVANLVAGVVAVAAAIAGLGVWSLVIQTYTATVIGLVWLWSRPVWTPSREIRRRPFLELARYGTPVVTMRLLDFAATRFFEVLLILRFGVDVYGLYAAGARLHQTLLQLLQSALNDVALTVLSRIQHDRARMGEIYLQAIMISAIILAPIFVASAALIPEISAVLFGERWSGVDEIARPLLLLGAVQAVQFLNGPYLAARGRPGLVLFISSLKTMAIPIAILAVGAEDVAGFVQVFALAQLIGTPVSFALTIRELKVPAPALMRRILPSIAACVAADLAVGALRPHIGFSADAPLVAGLLLGGIFAATYLLVMLLTAYRQICEITQFARNRMRLD